MVHSYLWQPPLHRRSARQPSQRRRSPSSCLPLVSQRHSRHVRSCQVWLTLFVCSCILTQVKISAVFGEGTKSTVRSVQRVILLTALHGAILLECRILQMRHGLWQRRSNIPTALMLKARCSSGQESWQTTCLAHIPMKRLLELGMLVLTLPTWVSWWKLVTVVP